MLASRHRRALSASQSECSSCASKLHTFLRIILNEDPEPSLTTEFFAPRQEQESGAFSTNPALVSEESENGDYAPDEILSSRVRCERPVNAEFEVVSHTQHRTARSPTNLWKDRMFITFGNGNPGPYGDLRRILPPFAHATSYSMLIVSLVTWPFSRHRCIPSTFSCSISVSGVFRCILPKRSNEELGGRRG